VRRLPAELARGGDPTKGRAVLRALISQQTQGRPLLQVSPQARWTANGLAAGYARATDARAGGVPVAEEASEGVYRTLIEGLESALDARCQRPGRRRTSGATPSPATAEGT